ncbi:MAG: DUF4190 domain-containing protein [Verrucomicrobiales bacterium]|nr:DUF4190 domain-containing protein [Verrucomicrobiales bacterium]
MTHSSHGADAEHWSRSAIASFVLSLMGFATLWMVIGLFLCAAGTVVGHAARYWTKVEGLRGRGLATVGTGLGYFSMLSFPVLMLVVGISFPAVNMLKTGQAEGLRKESQIKASRLFVACEAYARANSDRYPSEWKQLSGAFVATAELNELLRSPYPGGRPVAFEIVPHDRPVLDAIADSVIVIQEIAPATEKQIAVVYADGNVKSIYNPDS